MARNDKNRGIFRSVFDRMIEARLRQANALIAAHGYLHNEGAFDSFGRNAKTEK